MSETVQPYTSTQDPDPYNPNDDSGGGTGSSIPTGAAVPDLAMVVTAPPSFTGTTAGAGNDPPAAPPLMNDMVVDLGGIRELEDVLISASGSIVDAYTSLKALYEGGKDTVFGQNATVTTEITTTPGGGQWNWYTQTTADPLQQTAKNFADGTNGQPGMNDVEAYVLQQVGNAMGMLGQFMAMINHAGEAYAMADYNSRLPVVISEAESGNDS